MGTWENGEVMGRPCSPVVAYVTATTLARLGNLSPTMNEKTRVRVSQIPLNAGTWRFEHSTNFLHYFHPLSTACAAHRHGGNQWTWQWYNDRRTLAVALGIS